MTKKLIANVSVRAPQDLRAALEERRGDDGQKRSITAVVEGIIDENLTIAPDVQMRRAGDMADKRLTVCLRADLHHRLRLIADERCVKIGDLVYTLLARDLVSQGQDTGSRSSRKLSKSFDGLATAA